MKRLLISIVLAAIVMAGTAAHAGLMLAPGDKAPRLVARSLEGDMVTVRWTDQRVTLVNLWATWCIPCRDEMPELEKLQQEWQEQGLRVIGLAVDGKNVDGVRAMVEHLGVTYAILLSDTRLTSTWGGAGALPTSYLVDSQGRILLRVAGAGPEDWARLVERVHAELGGEAADPTPARP